METSEEEDEDTVPKCNLCKTEVGTKRCSACQEVWYCTRDHQVRHSDGTVCGRALLVFAEEGLEGTQEDVHRSREEQTQGAGGGEAALG